jgi:hypothetical protein
MPKLNRASYLVLCLFLCFVPALFVFISSAFSGIGLNLSIIPEEYYPFISYLSLFLTTVLTYPAGVIGSIVSFITLFFGILTPTEAFLLTTPLYIAAGYIQWYVVIPKYFKEKS